MDADKPSYVGLGAPRYTPADFAEGGGHGSLARWTVWAVERTRSGLGLGRRRGFGTRYAQHRSHPHGSRLISSSVPLQR